MHVVVHTNLQYTVLELTGGGGSTPTSFTSSTSSSSKGGKGKSGEDPHFFFDNSGTDNTRESMQVLFPIVLIDVTGSYQDVGC